MQPDMMRDRFRGALLGCFVGDALGRPFEGASPDDARLKRELAARLVRAGAWMYTDDTEMMIGVAESVIHRGGLDAEDVLRTMAAGYDPARGYGKGMKLSFAALAHGVSPERVAFSAWPEGSTGNGAAVRVVALACLHHHEPDRLEQLADQAAAITHAHPVGRAGCVLHSLALASALRLEPTTGFDRQAFLDQLARRIAGRHAGLAGKLTAMKPLVASPPRPREVVSVLGNGVPADESVPLALFAFVSGYPSFEGVVTRAIEHGGDTDTIGAMAGALIGAATGAAAIPGPWLDNLENAQRGRDHVVALADDLHLLWKTRLAGATAPP
jgi:poly(ADP-ribose) glycohydrolase ARH3